jgi:penicillin-binding protein 1A
VTEAEPAQVEKTQADEAQLASSGFELYPDTPKAPRIISPQNAYLITDMMHDVVRRGTGVRAYRALHRSDLAGKTGTSNDRRDAWFSGFNSDIVATAWVGFDQERSLGSLEEGGRTAAPMWIDFMREALATEPLHSMRRPGGLVEVRISPETGKVVGAGTPDAIFETFRVGHVPQRDGSTGLSPGGRHGGSANHGKVDEADIF